MKDALDKLIKKLVLRKYPIIKDYEIKISTLKGLGGSKKIAFEKYTFVYLLSPDEDGNFTVNEDLVKIEELTETLFKMLGPKDYQKFSGVEFYGDED
jgi:hypothetical protein